MAERRAFLLRMDPETYVALQRWAADDLRSLNAQVEFVLRRALLAEGRLGPQTRPVFDPPVGIGDVPAGTKEP